MRPTLSLHNVSRAFGGVTAVADVSLEIEAGKITGIIGPNGAGKTTLVNLITGLLQLSEGSIDLEGIDISTEEPAQIARRGIARTFQTIRLLKQTTVLDNVIAGFHTQQRSSLMANLFGLSSARQEKEKFTQEALQILKKFDMVNMAQRIATELSYGHQRRVEVMRAIAIRPKLILLDEPVAGMNDAEALTLGAILQTLASENVAVLLIEHNMRFVMSLCDHIHVLDSGKTIAAGTPQEIVKNQVVIDAYLGKSQTAVVDGNERPHHD